MGLIKMFSRLCTGAGMQEDSIDNCISLHMQNCRKNAVSSTPACHMRPWWRGLQTAHHTCLSPPCRSLAWGHRVLQSLQLLPVQDLQTQVTNTTEAPASQVFCGNSVVYCVEACSGKSLLLNVGDSVFQRL